MPRARRRDGPHTLHHVMNRAVGKRPLFEDDQDRRLFMACVARSVHRGEIEVLAFVLLTTHFHLLVRSLKGDLATALRRIQADYVRTFNRRHDRDGPLVRGRFCSRVVDTEGYLINVVRYIDQNPCEAGLAARPEDYEFGSARCYAQASGPPYLSRKVLESQVRYFTGRSTYDPADYAGVFKPLLTNEERAWILFRLESEDRAAKNVGHLLEAMPAGVRERMRARALVADGMEPFLPVAGPDAVMRAIQGASCERGPVPLEDRRWKADAWSLACVGLLRDVSRLTFGSIALRTALHTSKVRHLHARHVRYLGRDDRYRAVICDVLDRVLAVCGLRPLADASSDGGGA